MKKERTRKKLDDPALEMTPMIDVVFQLLIFFVVTLKQASILGHLDVSRPSPDPSPPQVENPELIDIMVYNEEKFKGQGYTFKGKKVSLEEIDRLLSKVASMSKDTAIVIKCTGDSSHAKLVNVLDICAKSDLKKISVFSM